MRNFLLFCFSIYFSSLSAQVDSSLAANFQAQIDQYLADNNYVGLNVAISLPDGSLWQGASGSSALDEPLRTDMIFGVGSVTKTFVAVLCLDLVSDGILSLEDSIGKWLDLDHPNIDRSITLRQLLDHTSGIADFVVDSAYLVALQDDLTRIWTPEQVVDSFTRAPYFAPGAGWRYSSTNYLIAGLMIEASAGEKAHVLMRERLLDPLGLNNTGFGYYDSSATLDADTAHVWFDILGIGAPIDLTLFSSSLEALYSGVWTAGGMLSTSADLIKWTNALYKDQIVLEPEQLEASLDFIPTTGQKYTGYSLGTQELPLDCGSEEDRIFYGHGGQAVYQGIFAYNSRDSLSIALQSNDERLGQDQWLEVFCLLFEQYDAFLTTTSTENSISSPITAAVYPNPTSDFAYLDIERAHPGDYSLSIRDLQGRLLHTNRISNISNSTTRIPIDLSSYAAGMYLLELKNGSFTKQYKLLRE